jgi:hypothetical protein
MNGMNWIQHLHLRIGQKHVAVVFGDNGLLLRRWSLWSLWGQVLPLAPKQFFDLISVSLMEKQQKKTIENS